MRVDELAPAPGSTHPKKRLGRGIGGKGGKTAGRERQTASYKKSLPEAPGHWSVSHVEIERKSDTAGLAGCCEVDTEAVLLQLNAVRHPIATF